MKQSPSCQISLTAFLRCFTLVHWPIHQQSIFQRVMSSYGISQVDIIMSENTPPELLLKKQSSNLSFYRRISSAKEEPHLLLSPHELVVLIKDRIQQVGSIANIGFDEALIQLSRFSWNLQTFKQSFYDQPEKIILDFDSQFCLICEQTKGIRRGACAHCFCNQCSLQYLKQILPKNLMVRCPKEDCKQKWTFSSMQHLVGIQILQKQLCDTFVKEYKFSRWCPGSNCSLAVVFDNLTQSEKFCKCRCGQEFCLKCYKSNHAPCSCSEAQKWTTLLVGQANEKWIKLNTKLCPKCKSPVERSTGCNFMKCSCQCTFCYVCSKSWAPDHLDHFKCSTPPTINSQQECKDFNKLNFYLQKYNGHGIAGKNLKLKLKQLNSVKRLLSLKLKIDELQTNCLTKAYQCMIAGSNAVQWSFSYSYFNESSQLFLKNQQICQGLKQNLAYLVQVNLQKILIELQSCDVYELCQQRQNWILFKSKLQALESQTSKYIESLKFY